MVQMVIDLKQCFSILKSVPKNWVSRQWHIFFLCSYSVKSKQMCGDANDCEDNLWWEKDILQPLLAKCEPKNISNTDGTAYFFKAMCSKTYAFVGKNVTGGKQFKDWLTVLVCANMDEGEKLTPIVGGKVKSTTALKR